MLIASTDLSQADYMSMLRYVTENMRDIDKREMICTMPDCYESLEQFLIDSAELYEGEKYVCINSDNIPVAVGGISMFYKNVGNAWFWATDEFEKVAIELTKDIRNINKAFLKNSGHRLQCLTASFHSNAQKWLETIGYKQEGKLVGLGKNGETFYQYSMLR